MTKATILINRHLIINDGKYVVDIKVFKVTKSKKFPYGIKAKYILRDVENQLPRLLIDNHEPFGFHMHSKLPGQKDFRIKLDTNDYNKALNIFFKEIERIIKNET